MSEELSRDDLIAQNALWAALLMQITRENGGMRVVDLSIAETGLFSVERNGDIYTISVVGKETAN